MRVGDKGDEVLVHAAYQTRNCGIEEPARGTGGNIIISPTAQRL